MLEACEDNYQRRSFLPHDRLVKLVTQDRVKNVLEDARVEDFESLRDFAFSQKRLFLILVMMSGDNEKVSKLRYLEQSKITDALLPIKIEAKAGVNSYCWFTLEPPLPLDRNGDKYVLQGIWTRQELDLLQGVYQWQFLAPVFGDSYSHSHFDTNRILPYLEYGSNPVSSGWFGEVSQAKIHRAHAPSFPTKPDAKSIAVAIKKAKDNEKVEKFFEKEADNLKKIRELPSPHLINPVASYQIGQDLCLVFPWAAGGNMLKY